MQQPTYLREGRKWFQIEALPEISGVYVQYRRNNDHEDCAIGAFNQEALDTIRTLEPRVIVLDHRFNGGGDYTTTAGTMREIASLLPENGKLYIVTGGATFSAGINSVAFAKEAAGDRAILIGQRIGDRERHWGETNEFVLPNSGIGITFATGMHDVANGCYDWRRCLWLDFYFGGAAGPLDPELPVALTFADYSAGRDPVMSRIVELERPPGS